MGKVCRRKEQTLKLVDKCKKKSRLKETEKVSREFRISPTERYSARSFQIAMHPITAPLLQKQIKSQSSIVLLYLCVKKKIPSG